MGGGGNPNFFLHISSSWVERNLHTEFQLHWMSISGRFMVGGATKSSNIFNRINGFLSLQLKLRLKLGFRLRLTKIEFNNFGPLLKGPIPLFSPAAAF